MASLLHMAVDIDHRRGPLLGGQIPLPPGGQGAFDCGADPDSQDFDNNTPVHIVKQKNCLGIRNALTGGDTHGCHQNFEEDSL